MKMPQLPLWMKRGAKIEDKATSTQKTSSLTKEDQDIILKIVQEFKDISRKDMQNWRQALEAANDINTPRWALLQDLYEYLEPDAQLGTSKDIRVATTLGRRFMIYSKKTGKEIPEKSAILKKYWFFLFVWNFLDAILYGYTVGQLRNKETMEFGYVPRRNVVPQRKMVLFEAMQDEGVNYTDPAFLNTVIAVQYKHQYGIVNDIVPNLIWKKNARQSWAEFAEKFGIHLISAQTNKTNKTDLDRIEAMLKSLGEAATAVLPVGTTVTIHDSATKGDPFNVYLKQIELDDQQIAKRLLGGTMITDSGSSRSQSEVHERTLKDILALFDKSLIEAVVNDQLLPMMGRNGYPFGDDEAFQFDESEDLTLEAQWKIVNEMLAHYDIDQAWISDTFFNVPIVEKKVKPIPPPGTGNAFPPDDDPAARLKRVEAVFPYPVNAMATALAGVGVQLPDYSNSNCCTHLPQADGFTDRLLGQLSDLLINDVFKGKDTLVNEVLKSVASYRHLLDGLTGSWSTRQELTYDAPDHRALAMMEYNIFEFSRLKEKANVFKLNELLIDSENQTVRGWSSFQKEAQQYLKNPDSRWLATEYNLTIATGQNASRYHQFYGERETVTNWVEYQTVGDSHVRPKHAALDGKIFSLTDKGSKLGIWPPNEHGCRCEMLQYLGTPPKELIMTSADAAKSLGIDGTDWDVNRGNINEVFTANQMYLKNKLDYGKEMKSLNYSDYGLKPHKDIQAVLPNLTIDQAITPGNIANEWKPAEGTEKMYYSDYLGRQLSISKKDFDRHTTGSYVEGKEKRHQLFPHINDIISNPDEVYFFAYKGGALQTRYVKYYGDEVLIVNTNAGADGLNINTWYNDLSGKDEAFRNGYLIHKKTAINPG